MTTQSGEYLTAGERVSKSRGDTAEVETCPECNGVGGVLVDSMTLYGVPGGEDWARCEACSGAGQKPPEDADADLECDCYTVCERPYACLQTKGEDGGTPADQGVQPVRVSVGLTFEEYQDVRQALAKCQGALGVVEQGKPVNRSVIAALIAEVTATLALVNAARWRTEETQESDGSES